MNSENHQIYLGNTPVKRKEADIKGSFLKFDGEDFYCINDYDEMPPFFMTVVSSTDHWLFIASNGGLTAGRRNPESALFPYYTDDKIIESAGQTGSKTIIRVKQTDKWQLWEPFLELLGGFYTIQRKIYKNKEGNKIIFEETNKDLSLVFRYQWTFSEDYGIVKKSELENLSTQAVAIEILDGMQNLLPYGVGSNLQNTRSTLVDAYKKNELEENGLAIISLSAMIVDKAEPSEALKATTVWSAGLQVENYLLSSLQLDEFRKGSVVKEEIFKKATKGAYFVNSEFQLGANENRKWCFAAEVNQSQTDVITLQKQLENPEDLQERLEKSIRSGTLALRRIVASADGIQLTRDTMMTGRHFTNVLFNVMRGGIFENQYNIDKKDLFAYVVQVNRYLSEKYESFFSELPENLDYQELLAIVNENGDKDLIRICTEYLPLSFSRRHGDPSRPWNYFSIETTDDHGNKQYNYQGNWRDIFQNWEALAYSYPAFVEGMITKFLNASTIDGYNPYRITRQGIDWEVIEPDDPWSFIGYWGDHQIIYLLKLLEHAEAHFPGRLSEMLTSSHFVYANVPYRIKGYKSIVNDPQDTIDFDHDLHKEIMQRASSVGSDGKLIWSNEKSPLHANLTEKILVTVLTKLYNYIPGAGIWLNTQRPEWNDANNALVGNGVSMVTLYYLRRFLKFIRSLFKDQDTGFPLHEPVATLLDDVTRLFVAESKNREAETSSRGRKAMVDALGKAGEAYRKAAYKGFDKDQVSVTGDKILRLIESAITVIDRSIAENQREDNLYHAYNLLSITDEEIQISHLYEMLEGQVAVLSAGVLDAEEALAVLDALKSSEMYREDQYSYMLYPDRDLPSFLEKNTIAPEQLEELSLVKALEANADKRLLEMDVDGNYHFMGSIRNADDVRRILNDLSSAGYTTEVAKDKKSILDVFEETFNHKAFTGRSGTFYGYEGLGSIYWHMVSKLLVAVQENIYRGIKSGASEEVLGRLTDHYYEIRAGIGINKSPGLYGAFPTDAYSHTPSTAGAQQPGMTGQVKEDILNRWAELGVRINEGRLEVQPVILNRSEFLEEESAYIYLDVGGEWREINLTKGEMAFTYCGVPFIYSSGDKNSLTIIIRDREEIEINGLQISENHSKEIFNRSGSIEEVRIEILGGQ